jgi:Leucine-rich repeat (LRR) protein
VNLIITKPNQTVTKIFTNIPKVNEIKVLKMHDQIVHHLPTSLETFFPELNVLQIWSCGLRSLSQSDLKVFENLNELSLSGNEIEVLPSNLFSENLKISKIDFSRNNLKHVGFNLLTSLDNLIFADFYRNFCISDGSRSRKVDLIKNLRKSCKPTHEMLIEDLTTLNEEVKMMKNELKACEKVHRSRRCGDDDRGTIVGLDSLFPSIFVSEENRIDRSLKTR